MTKFFYFLTLFLVYFKSTFSYLNENGYFENLRALWLRNQIELETSNNKIYNQKTEKISFSFNSNSIDKNSFENLLKTTIITPISKITKRNKSNKNFKQQLLNQRDIKTNKFFNTLNNTNSEFHIFNSNTNIFYILGLLHLSLMLLGFILFLIIIFYNIYNFKYRRSNKIFMENLKPSLNEIIKKKNFDNYANLNSKQEIDKKLNNFEGTDEDVVFDIRNSNYKIALNEKKNQDMNLKEMSLEAIIFKNGKLKLLDQLKLPFITSYISIETVKDGWAAIHEMKVRGAPAIAIAGVLSVAVELYKKEFENIQEIKNFTFQSLDYLITARPTAVNIADAAQKIKDFCITLEKQILECSEYKQKLIEKMNSMLEEDVATNRSIGNYGALDIIQRLGETTENANILTHCNTGSLATAGYGTALGVVRRLKELNKLNHCFCTETRPYNQGSRLTAYELVYEKISSTLICDNMVGLLLSTKKISAIVVGADRVVSNGDTANKIGTYQLAILAKHHNIPFYVAVPTTSIDLTKKNGSEIVIEERPSHEMTHVKDIRIAAEGINCWNPSFDITPGELITGGLITEHGIFKPSELENKLKTIYNN